MATKPRVRKRKTLGSYPFLSVVFSITMALLVLGLFGALITHARRLQQVIQENLEVQVYLDKNLPDPSRLKVQQTLLNKAYLATSEGVAQLSFISKEQAAEEFLEDAEQEIALIGENPLRDAYILKLASGYYVEDSLQLVKADILDIEGVFEVTYVQNLIQTIQENITKISLILLSFAGLLVLVVIVLIHNTIKLALFSQRFLIRSMQLVGAKPGFIKRPFLARSLLHGLLAGLLSAALLYWLLQWAYLQIPDLALLANTRHTLLLLLSLVLFGGLLAWFSTRSAMNKYLKLSLDELY